MSVNAYLTFRGNCREAVQFYAVVFGVEIKEIITYGEHHSAPEEIKDWIMHAKLVVNGSPLMFSDAPPDRPYSVGNNISLVIMERDEEKLRKWFDKLKEGGEVHMELQETFWSKLYGMVTDKFGIGWQLNLAHE